MLRHYSNNPKWLVRFAPFHALAVSVAYVVPFLLDAGLSLAEVLYLQAIFSVAAVLLEVPSGWFADRFGRAFSIKLSLPFAVVAMLLYAVSTQYWQFVVCELLLAVGNSLLSGIDTALLKDSLDADGRSNQFTRYKQRMNAAGYVAIAVAVPVGAVLVHFVGLASTLVADAVLCLIGGAYCFRLVEAPHQLHDPATHERVWVATKRLMANAEVRSLVLLTLALSTATYLGFWLSVPYYETLGVPVVWFGAILAVRSLGKAALSHYFHRTDRLQQKMVWYTVLVLAAYVGMASQSWWLVLLVLGHDVVQALHGAPLLDRLNSYMHARHRATLNGTLHMLYRLSYAAGGVAVGLLTKAVGLQLTMLLTGALCALLAGYALVRLHHLRTLKDTAYLA